jgi:cold shock CspA family protein
MPTNTATKTGIVKFYDQSRGFGFLFVDGSAEQLFFHATGLTADCNTPCEGDRVSFSMGKGRDGRPCGQNVAVME